MKTKFFFGTIFIFFVGALATYTMLRLYKPDIYFSNNDPLACTEEALLCPDGTSVVRAVPNCLFPLCPDVSALSHILDGQTCFSYRHEASLEAPYDVHEYMELKVSDAKVTGTKTGTQQGPDMSNGYTGSLDGSIVGNLMTVVYVYTVEGSSNKEQEWYRIIDEGLVKERYPLIETSDMLVPDITGTMTELTYTKVECER